MIEKTFKKGDRVRYVGKMSKRFGGLSGTVVSVPYSQNVQVKFDDGRMGGVYPHNITLLAEEGGEWIVSSVQRGKLKASIYPRVHSTEAAAREEALRLAAKEPGTTFKVLKVVGSASAEVPAAQYAEVFA